MEQLYRARDDPDSGTACGSTASAGGATSRAIAGPFERDFFSGGNQLGITTGGSLEPQLAEYSAPRKARVASVTTDSAAAKAGVKAGDVITTFNGSVSDPNDLRTKIRNLEGGEFTLGIMRDEADDAERARAADRASAGDGADDSLERDAGFGTGGWRDQRRKLRGDDSGKRQPRRFLLSVVTHFRRQYPHTPGRVHERRRDGAVRVPVPLHYLEQAGSKGPGGDVLRVASERSHLGEDARWIAV